MTISLYEQMFDLSNIMRYDVGYIWTASRYARHAIGAKWGIIKGGETIRQALFVGEFALRPAAGFFSLRLVRHIGLLVDVEGWRISIA